MTMRAAILGIILGWGVLPAQEPVQTMVPATAVPAAEHPYLETGFYPAWSKMTPQAAVEDIQAAVKLAWSRYEAIRAVKPGEETWENVFEAFQLADKEYLDATAYWNHLTMVRQAEGIREAQQIIVPLMSGFKAAVSADSGLQQVIKRAAAQPWVQELSPAKRIYVQELLDRFQESADLPSQQKAYLQELSREHGQLQRAFDRNVINSPSTWYHEVQSMDELAGMPEAWLQRVAAMGTRNGHLVLQLGMAYDVLRMCTNEATRKLCWEGLNIIGNCGEFDNAPLIARIMEVRQELAVLGGFKNYADKMCRKRMVDTGDKALAFVDGLMGKLQPAYKQEYQELLDFVSGIKGGKVEALNPWDIPFYSDQLSRARNNFDQESVRPYFRSDNVLKGMFGVASKLYDITITEQPSVCLTRGQTCPEGYAEVWHPTVQVFKVTDNKTGAHLGSFYLDAYPRFGKQWGAWTQAMRPGLPGKEGQPHQPHLVVVSTNFNPPSRKGYALFAPRDVEQLFHEFGHVMHNILSDTEIHMHSGTYVALDFAELPSQLFENWAWEPEVISTMAFHHETGEPMPAELVQKLVEHRYFMPATAAMEKLFTAKLDLEMHMHYAEKFAGKQLDDACNELLAPWRVPMTALPPSPMRMCVHCLARNYCAGYFCYNWADVMAADAFSKFKKDGILNPTTGAAFRNEILRYGSDKPAIDLYRAFMGRDPQPDALMEKYGVKNTFPLPPCQQARKQPRPHLRNPRRSIPSSGETSTLHGPA